MKKIYFLFVFCFVGIGQAQVINFTDPIFKAKLLEASPTNTIAHITFWPPVNGSITEYVKIDSNNNGEIEESEAAIIKGLNVSNSNINSLNGIEYFTGLSGVNCSGNNLTNLRLASAGSLNNSQLNVNCRNNQLTSIDYAGFVGALVLDCGNNNFTSLDFSNFNSGLLLTCDNNPLTHLEFRSTTILEYLDCSNTLLTVLDISGNSTCEMLISTNIPTLNALMIKDAVDIDADMGDMWSSFNFSNNPNLRYLCVSENRLTQAQNRLNQYGYTNCSLNAYCDFNPGSPYYTIEGNNRLDMNSNGCDALDNPYPNLRLGITNGNVLGTIPSTNGNYFISVTGGSHTVTPIIENPAYFVASPASFTVSFPSQSSPYIRDFCISPIGTHTDLEVTLIGRGARPGFDSSYTLLLRNKGTTTESGTLNLNFDDTVLDFISANPAVSSQTFSNLTWNFTNLGPLQSQTIELVFNVNAPTETPAVNSGDVLHFTASIGMSGPDEVLADNTFSLNQTVVNSFDPNDKTCLQGNIISPDNVGQFVHYVIRFENTGTANAENVVVKDVIDTTKFEITSLVPLASSHSFVTRQLSGNKVEFIFQNIQLPFDDANNDGYVAFKIKTKPTLVIGNTFSNTANIYFDYNSAIITNTATTAIQTLGNPDLEFNRFFNLSPVPAKDFLNLRTKDEVLMRSLRIYNMMGQVMQVMVNPSENIDVSALTSGNYLVKVITDKGTATGKFIKE